MLTFHCFWFDFRSFFPFFMSAHSGWATCVARVVKKAWRANSQGLC